MLNKLIISIMVLCMLACVSSSTQVVKSKSCAVGDKSALWMEYNTARDVYNDLARTYYTNCDAFNESDIFCIDLEKNWWDAEFRMLQKYSTHNNTCPLGD